MVRNLSLLLLLVWLVPGCKAPTVETRKKEHPAVYAALAPEQKVLVDEGKIKVGMSPDAVTLAWGPPSEVLESETPQGHITNWVYYGQSVQEYRYWVGRHPESDFYPRSYVQAEVIFQNGQVVSWRTLPKPLQ